MVLDHLADLVLILRRVLRTCIQRSLDSSQILCDVMMLPAVAFDLRVSNLVHIGFFGLKVDEHKLMQIVKSGRELRTRRIANLKLVGERPKPAV